MKHKRTILSTLLGIGISAATCGPGKGSAEGQCRDALTNSVAANDTLCQCLVADGTFPDQQSCTSTFSSGAADIDCICDVYGAYPESADYLDCVQPAQKKVLDCYESSACDPVKLDACVDAHLPALMACEPPPGLGDDLEAKCSPWATTGDEPTGEPPTSGPMTSETGETGDTGGPEGVPVDGMGCVLACVADLGRETPVLDPGCVVSETNSEGVTSELPACEAVNGSWQPPDGAQVCHALRIDRTGQETLSKIDDISLECREQGFNLELQVVREVPPDPGTVVSLSCQLSDNQARDCPNL